MAARPRSWSISAADFAREIWLRSLRKMAAGDMAALVRDHADDLVGRLGVHQRAGMDEHIVPIDDEGVEGAVVDDVDVDALSAEARGVQDRLGIGADQRFRLGIADHAAGLGRGRADERNDQTADGGAAKVSQGTSESRGRHHRA